jgi:hypothetical protein
MRAVTLKITTEDTKTFQHWLLLRALGELRG